MINTIKTFIKNNWQDILFAIAFVFLVFNHKEITSWVLVLVWLVNRLVDKLLSVIKLLIMLSSKMANHISDLKDDIDDLKV